jgi:hypothetical protein
MMDKWKGMKVEHPTFGMGTIISVTPNQWLEPNSYSEPISSTDGDIVVEVKFENPKIGTKNLVQKFAQLKKIKQ